MTRSSEQIGWIASLRGFACLLVVALHVTSIYVTQYGKIPGLAWQIGNTIDSFTRMSVPLFFALSGALFLHGKEVRSRNALKVIGNLVVYSALAVAYLYFVLGFPVTHTILAAWHKPVFFHLWFFYTLIPVYLLLAVLDAKRIDPLKGIAICAALFIALNPKLGLFPAKSPILIEGSVIYYFLYALIGAFVVAAPMAGLPLFLLAFLSLLGAWTWIVLDTAQATTAAGKLIAPLYSYTGIPVFIATLSALWYFKNADLPRGVNAALRFVGRYSLPIYGVHALVLDYIGRAGLRNYQRPLWDIPLSFLATLAASVLFAFVLDVALRSIQRRLEVHTFRQAQAS